MTELRCFDPEDTERFRRGYPHLVTIVDDDHPIPAGPAKPPKLDRLYKDYWGTYADLWPRTLARQFVRTFPVDRTLKVPPVEGGETIDAAEAAQLLTAMCATPGSESADAHERWLFILEALAGTDVVLPALVAALAALPAKRRNTPAHDDEIIAYLGYLAGFLLLRASPKVAAAARKELTALWTEATKSKQEAHEGNLKGALDLALHGMEGARRVLTDSHWQYLHWWGFVDDATMLNERFEHGWKSEWHAHPRHIWLGGEAVLPNLLGPKAIRKLGKQRGLFFAQIAKLDHPEVARVMSEALEDKYAGEIAAAYGKGAGATRAKPSKPSKPPAKAAAPKKSPTTSKPAKPTSKPAKPTSKPAKPTSKPAKPTSKPKSKR